MKIQLLVITIFLTSLSVQGHYLFSHLKAQDDYAVHPYKLPEQLI